MLGRRPNVAIIIKVSARRTIDAMRAAHGLFPA